MEYHQNLSTITALAIGGTISYFTYDLFVSKTLEDITITNIGRTDIYFLEESQVKSVCSHLIYVNKFDNCLRSVDILTPDIKVGDKIKSISYRSPLFGNCKVLTEIVKEK